MLSWWSGEVVSKPIGLVLERHVHTHVCMLIPIRMHTCIWFTLLVFAAGGHCSCSEMQMMRRGHPVLLWISRGTESLPLQHSKMRSLLQPRVSPLNLYSDIIHVHVYLVGFLNKCMHWYVHVHVRVLFRVGQGEICPFLSSPSWKFNVYMCIVH